MSTSYVESRDVFYHWVTTDSVTSSSSTTFIDSVWGSWTSDTSYTATSSIDRSATSSIDRSATWSNWIADPQSEVYIVKTYESIKPIPKPKKSAEQLRAERVQRNINTEWRKLIAVEEKERKKLAELTAQELLEDLISKEESEHYRKTGRLLVTGRQFDYVIQKGRGVYKVEKDKVKDLCIHLVNKYSYPETDNVIGLKLLIESNEKEFLKTANDNGELYGEELTESVLKLVKRAA